MRPIVQGPLVAIACGGTGGHLFPGIAIAEEILPLGGRVVLLVSNKDLDRAADRAISAGLKPSACRRLV